ncbi:MAG: exosortase U [Pirellulales bacterium]|nr:exosortase U [Pirellulales bacterium]
MTTLSWNADPAEGRIVPRTVLIAAAVAVAAAYAPMLAAFFQQLWSSPQSQYFPFVFAAFGGLLYVRWQEADPAPAPGADRPVRASRALTALAWASLAGAGLLYNPWASMASLIVLAAAGLALVGRYRRVTYLWGIWLLLWLVLPLPLGLEQQLVAKLQLASSRLSSFILDLVGVAHLMDGNTLLLAGRELFVDEACSGIVSVKSLIACAVIYGVWRNRPPLHLAALAAAGVLWAMLMNSIRISLIAGALHYFDVDWTKGAPHEILSLGVFVVAFGALISTEFLLAAGLAPVLSAWNQQTGVPLRFGRWPAAVWDAIVRWGDPLRTNRKPPADDVAPVAAAASAVPAGVLRLLRTATIAFGALAVAQFGFLAWAWFNPTTAHAHVASATTLAESSLPEQLAGTARVGFEETKRERGDVIFGEFSRTYQYQGPSGERYVVSCDFPFSQGWHELTICYSGAGWEVARRDWSTEEIGDQTWTAVEVDLAKPDGARAFVSWSMFDEFGEPVSPPMGAIRDQLWRLLVRRHPLAPSRQMFQVQVLVAAPGELADETKQIARRLLHEARTHLLRQVIQGSPATAESASDSPAEPTQATAAPQS